MTTKPQPSAVPPAAAPVSCVVVKREEAIRLKMTPLGIAHRPSDFPVRFIEFCQQNDRYENVLPGSAFPVRQYIFDLE